MSNPNLVRKTVDPTNPNSGGEISLLSSLLPPGTVLDTAATAAPSGWLFCHGQAVSRTTYSALFAAIGTTYGVGDGSTTFNLPDTRGRVRASKDNMGGSAANRLTPGGSGITGTTLGATGGAETHTLSTAQMPSHTHIQDPHSHSYNDSGHSHSESSHFNFGAAGGGNNVGAFTAGTTGSSLTGISINSTTSTNQNTGGSQAHQNTQPTIIFNTIIKF